MIPRLQGGKVHQWQPDSRSERPTREKDEIWMFHGVREGFPWEVVPELGFVAWMKFALWSKMGKREAGKGKRSVEGSWVHIAGVRHAGEGEGKRSWACVICPGVGLCPVVLGSRQWMVFSQGKTCQINMLEDSLESVWRGSHAETDGPVGRMCW